MRAQIPFMDRHGNTRYIASDNPEVIRFLRSWNEVYEKLNLSYVMRPNGMALRTDITQAEQLDGLNHLFVVQAVISLLKRQELEDNFQGPQGLARAMEIHHWVFWVQIAHGVVHDGVRVIRLVRLALNNKGVIEASASMMARAIAKGVRVFEGVGLALLPLYIGLDIYELSQAVNLQQRAIFATQLAMDSLNSLVMATSLGASAYASFGLAGASAAATLSSLLGGAGVITGGLMIGAFGLASAYAGEYAQVHQVAEYFDQIDSAYRQGGYHYNDESNALDTVCWGGHFRGQSARQHPDLRQPTAAERAAPCQCHRLRGGQLLLLGRRSGHPHQRPQPRPQCSQDLGL